MGDVAAAAAAVVYGAAMVMLLAVRSWQQRRATGSSGFHGFTGMASGGAERVAGVCFMAAVVWGLVSPVLAGLHLLPASWRAEHWAAAGWVWGRVGGRRRRGRVGGGGAADDGRVVAGRG